MEKVRKNGLSKKQLLLRREVIISEIKRIADKLNKPIISQYDFMTNANIDFPQHAFIKVFGGFNNAIEAAGLKRPEYNFYKKRKELEEIYKQIAINNDNKLSMKILICHMKKSPKAIELELSLYFGGLISFCKRVKCQYISNNTSSVSFFNNYDNSIDTAEIRKDQFSKRVLEIAAQHDNSLSTNILTKEYVPYNSVRLLSSAFYGGLANMCKELRINWIESNYGIDQKELDILKDLRDVYKANDNRISRSFYSKKGKYSLEAVEDYFGSFGKACLEVNIRTEAMKA